MGEPLGLAAGVVQVRLTLAVAAGAGRGAGVGLHAEFGGVNIDGDLTLKTKGGSIGDANLDAKATVTPTGGMIGDLISSGDITAKFEAWNFVEAKGVIHFKPPPMLALTKLDATVGYDQFHGLYASITSGFPSPLSKDNEEGTFEGGISTNAGLFATINFPASIPGFEKASVSGTIGYPPLAVAIGAHLVPKNRFFTSCCVSVEPPRMRPPSMSSSAASSIACQSNP